MKKLIIIIGGALVFIAAGIFMYKNWRHYFIRHKVGELVFLKSDSLYNISYDDVYIDEVGGEIKIENLRLRPDTTYKKSTDSTLPRQLLNVFVPLIHITGVHTDEAVLNKEIIAKKIQLTNPVVVMYPNAYAAKSKKKGKLSTHELYRVILRELERIKIDTILLTNVDYTIQEWVKNDTILTGNSINAHLFGLNISDSTSNDSSRVLFSEHAKLTVPLLTIRDKKGLYNFRFNDIAVNSDDRIFFVKGVYVLPLLNENTFMQAARWQTDRFSFDFSDVRFKNTDIHQLLEGNMIADSMIIAKSVFKIFRDLSYQRENKSKVGNYPHQALLRAPMDVSLKNVVIQNGYIEYKEKNPKSNNSGTIHFDNVYATIKNVTNRNNDIAENNICRLDFKSSFLNRAPLNATLLMYLKNPNGWFRINGRLNKTDATVFNQLTKPLALAEIESGQLNSLTFDLTGTDYRSRGTVILRYEDLKLSLLRKNRNDEYKRKSLSSFIANIAIKNENPENDEPVRKASISYERDTQRSFFNLLWKSIFVGVKESVGVKDK